MSNSSSKVSKETLLKHANPPFKLTLTCTKSPIKANVLDCTVQYKVARQAAHRQSVELMESSVDNLTKNAVGVSMLMHTVLTHGK